MGKGGGGGTQSSIVQVQKQFFVAIMGGIDPETSVDFHKENHPIPKGYWPKRDPNNLFDAAYNATAGPSPYDGELAIDVGTLEVAGADGNELHRVQERITDLQDELFDGVSTSDPTSGTAMDLSTRWNAWVNAVENAPWIDDAVDAFADGTKGEHLRAVNRLATEFASINAVNSTGYMMARTLLEADRLRVKNNRRAALVDKATSDLMRMWMFSVDAKRSIVGLQQDASRMSVVAKVDQSRINVDLTSQDMFWDLDVWSKAANVLGSMTGSVTSDMREHGPSKAQSAVAGMAIGAGVAIMAGAEIGAKAGGLAGPWGIAAGAAIGGVAGLIAG